MTVGGGHELRVSSKSPDTPRSDDLAVTTMTNVRFVVEDGSSLSFRLADDDERGYEHQHEQHHHQIQQQQQQQQQYEQQQQEHAGRNSNSSGRGSTTFKFQGIAQQVSNKQQQQSSSRHIILVCVVIVCAVPCTRLHPAHPPQYLSVMMLHPVIYSRELDTTISSVTKLEDI